MAYILFYKVGNVQLTHPGGQAPVERRSAILTQRERHSARFNPIRFSKRQVDPAHRRVTKPCGSATYLVMFWSRFLTLTSPSFLEPSGDEGIRTPDLRRAKAALSQLSYIPERAGFQVGLSGLEPETSPLSEARSNQLS